MSQACGYWKSPTFTPHSPLFPRSTSIQHFTKIASNINLHLTCSFHTCQSKVVSQTLFLQFQCSVLHLQSTKHCFGICQPTVVSQTLFLQFQCSVLHLQSTKHCFVPISVLENTFPRSSASNLKLKQSNKKKEFQVKKEFHLVWWTFLLCFLPRLFSNLIRYWNYRTNQQEITIKIMPLNLTSNKLKQGSLK